MQFKSRHHLKYFQKLFLFPFFFPSSHLKWFDPQLGNRKYLVHFSSKMWVIHITWGYQRPKPWECEEWQTKQISSGFIISKALRKDGGRHGLVVITLAWQPGDPQFKSHSRKKNFHLLKFFFWKEPLNPSLPLERTFISPSWEAAALYAN